MMHALCRKVLDNGGELISFSEYSSYDETPLPVMVKAEEAVVVPIACAAVVPAEADGGNAVIKTASEEPKAKILQMEYRISFLVKIGRTYQDVNLELPCPLQVIDRDTGDTYAHCLDFSKKGIDSISGQFQRRDRHVMSDSDTAVQRGERPRDKAP